MNTDLQKKLEEAANKHLLALDYMEYVNHNPVYSEDQITDSFEDGAEQGYKEAIEQAKEWMRNYFPDELDGKGFEFVSRDEILADFEADMNKLWEEKK